MVVTRGFRGRPRADDTTRSRVPPGQYVTTDFPVLTAGPTQHTALDDWTLSMQLAGRLLAQWSWREFEALPQTDITTDIHCVTKWTKFDTRWRGVSFDDLLRAAGLDRAPTGFVMVHGDGGYSANLPIADLIDGKAMVATHFDGLPISPSHGGPARLLVPHLYFWKSAKWVRRIAFREQDSPGFWESLGYHIRGDPWREQRYDGDS
ncbi:sulfite oxidase-like oxidoreductase [Sphingomonas sp. PR090111-T3T-6A]|uniref:sulfite oxidase-like oxidoreductase n=1 Tax=Sphingomonas sp. PR090111-T3T-6A TaxID=685778 RepID=UPI0004764B4B|nr:sulfite oxidase-like oxidoreductase [Sphingomonas sp. PR090111-T3T-6A]